MWWASQVVNETTMTEIEISIPITEWSLRYLDAIFKMQFWILFLLVSSTPLKSMPSDEWDLTDDELTLVQVMAWCRQATSHYMRLCWANSVLLSLAHDELILHSFKLQLRFHSEFVSRENPTLRKHLYIQCLKMHASPAMSMLAVMRQRNAALGTKVIFWSTWL